MANLLAFAKKKIQQAGNIVHNDVVAPVQRDVVQPIQRDVIQPVQHVAQQLPTIPSLPSVAGHALTAIAPHIPTFAPTSPLRFANNAVINPIKQTDTHVGKLFQGQNPYKGNTKQQAGQALQDALNIASVVPAGKAADIAVKGGAVLPKVIEGAKFGAKAGTGFGGAQGLSTALKGNQNLPQSIKTVAKNAALGGVGGAALGAAAPAVAGGVEKLATSRIPLNEAGGIKRPSLPPEKSPKIFSTPVQVNKNIVQQGREVGVQKPNTQELKIGKALGMSKQDVAKAKAADSAQPQVTQPKMSVPKGVKDQLNPKVPFKRAAAENTQLNPTKINIPEVKPGDYEQARINPQLASSPIDYATGQAVKAAQKLSPEEQKNIPHLVENPSLAKSPAAKEFVARHHALTNLSHATSQSLGGNTNFVPNYFRHNVDLSNPADAKRWEDLVAKRGGAAADPYAFGGIDNMNRVFGSVKELQNAGFHLKNENNHIQNIIDYGKSASSTLKRQALVKGFTEADMAAGAKPHNFDLHNGNVLPLSEQGMKEIQGYSRPSKAMGAHATYRTANRKLKQGLLSASEFHPINITSKAAPALAAEGHPVLAAKGAYGAFRAQVGKGYSDKLQQAAFKDGTVEAAARLGTPIKFGSDYANEGKLNLGKAGFGEKTIFEKSMPALHIRMVQGLVKDLNKQGLSLDSPEAHAAGTRINELMGFVNTEARNLNQGHQRALSDVALAPQFTRAKWATLKSALRDTQNNNKSLAGSYARRAVVANAATDFAFIAGLGYVMKQKSDNIRDILLRALVSPAVPTPLKDKKGNNIQLKTPASYTSEALGLAVTLERGKDGHLTPKFEPSKVPGNIANYGRNRLAILPSNALKLATNTNYAGKPLYDPNAKFGTKAEQAATTVASGLLPIGLQGIAQTKAVKSRLPGNVQDVINANSPGANPLLKSVGSSFGLTPTTDKTVGKGLQNDQYFAAKDKFTKSLNPNETALFNTVNPVKKNPLTGQPVYDSTIFNKAATYNVLADNPKFTAKYQAYQKSQASHDPLWDLPQKQLQSVLLTRGGKTYPGQTYTKAGASLAQATGTDQPWYKDFLAKEQNFYSSLPAGSGASKNDYGPQASPYVSQQLTSKNYKDPQVQQYFNARDAYTNSQRQQTGLTPIAPFGKVGVSGQLDNPEQLAITPKGSNYGTGKAKNSSGIRKSSSRVAKAKFITPKIAKIKAPKQPKIAIKKTKIQSFTPKKISVAKIPKIKVG